MVGKLLEEDMLGVWKNKEAFQGLVGSLGGFIQVSMEEGYPFFRRRR